MWSREIDKSPLIRNIYTQLAQNEEIPQELKVKTNFFGLGARTVKLVTNPTEIRIDDLVNNLLKDLRAVQNFSDEDKAKYKNIIDNLQKINNQKTGIFSDLFGYRKQLLLQLATGVTQGKVYESAPIPRNRLEKQNKKLFDRFHLEQNIPIVEQTNLKNKLFEKYMKSSQYDFIWRSDNQILIKTKLPYNSNNDEVEVLMMVIGNPLGDPGDLNYKIVSMPGSKQAKISLEDLMSFLESTIQTVSDKIDFAVKELSREEKLKIIQTSLPKEENGYPSVDFNDAINLLGKQSLKPTLLLIDEVGEGFNKVTANQIELIKKTKEMKGQIIVCCRPAESNLKDSIKGAIGDYPYTFFIIQELNKLENQELLATLKKSDYVIAAGYDINECVRATVGAQRDDTSEKTNKLEERHGMIQEEIPILFPDKCSQGKSFNRWEGARFDKSLFFWSREKSNYRLADQAVKEYRKEMSSIPADYEQNFNNKKLKMIRSAVSQINGLTTNEIKSWFHSYKIAPNNPLLDQITRQS